MEDNENPTYGDLIDFLNAAEVANATNNNGQSVAEISFSCKYPHIPISRPSRFLCYEGN